MCTYVRVSMLPKVCVCTCVCVCVLCVRMCASEHANCLPIFSGPRGPLVRRAKWRGSQPEPVSVPVYQCATQRNLLERAPLCSSILHFPPTLPFRGLCSDRRANRSRERATTRKGSGHGDGGLQRAASKLVGRTAAQSCSLPLKGV